MTEPIEIVRLREQIAKRLHTFNLNMGGEMHNWELSHQPIYLDQADVILALTKPDGTKAIGVISDEQVVLGKKVCNGCPDRFSECVSNNNFVRLVK